MTMMERKTKRRAIDLRDHKGYAAAHNKLAVLQARQSELEEKIEGLGGNESPRVQTETEALRLLEHDDAAVAEIPNDAGKLERELAVVTKAIELQAATCETEKSRARFAVRSGLLAEHKRLAADIGAALSDLRAALEAERSFRDELERSDLNFGEPLKPVAFSAGGLGASEVIDRIDGWFSELNQSGYLAEGTVQG